MTSILNKISFGPFEKINEVIFFYNNNIKEEEDHYSENESIQNDQKVLYNFDI